MNMKLPRLCSRPRSAFFKFVLPSGVILYIIKLSIYANFETVSRSENSMLMIENSARLLTISETGPKPDKIDSASKPPNSFSIHKNSASVFRLSLNYTDLSNGNVFLKTASTLSMRASEQKASVEVPQLADEQTVDIEKERHKEQSTEDAKENVNTEEKEHGSTQENKEVTAQDNVQENNTKEEKTQGSIQKNEKTSVNAQETQQGNQEKTENIQDNVPEKTDKAQDNVPEKVEKAQDNVQDKAQDNVQDKAQDNVQEKAQDNVQEKTEKAQDNVPEKLKEKKEDQNYRGPKWRCSDDSAAIEIESVCDLYRRGLITGSLCPALCDRKQLALHGCDRLSWQKKVMRVNCTDACREGLTVPAILKTQVINVTQTIEDLRIKSSEPFLHDTQQLYQRIRELILLTVKNNLGFLPFNESQAVEVMWGQVQGQGHDLPQENRAVWRSVSLLMMQQEYLFATSLKEARVFPETYGSCGHYFVQESCKPPTHWSQEHTSHSHLRTPWAERAGGALKLLEFHQNLDKSLPDRLFNCDLKLANFGLCDDGTFKMIDSNNVYFNASMTYHLRSHLTPPCKTDSQCVYFSSFCEGACDVKTGTCYMPYDINLEFTCRDVFMDKEDIKYQKTSFDGIGHILRHPPASVQPELSRVLSDCESLIRLHQPGEYTRVMDELTSILRRSLRTNT